jgi:adenylate kinase
LQTQSKLTIMLNLILFGPPGSGKGTQAEKLKENYQLIHISTGDLFRFEISNNTPLGLKAKEYMSAGKLVPDEVTIGMLRNKVEMHPDSKGFIFDGFPRTIAQAEALDAFLNSMNTNITVLISLLVDEEEIVQRIIERGKTSGRTDDADENIVRNRIQVYKEETSPVFGYYRQKEKSVLLEGMGSVDTIFARLTNCIDRYL